MSIKQKVKMMILAGALVMVGVAAIPVGAITCEEGSIRGAGVQVENAADCNVAVAKEGQDLNSVVTTIVNVLVAVMGVVAVAVIIYGGAQMVLSQGDPGRVKNGKMAVIAGVTGLIIATMAWAIVNVVLASI